MRRAFTEWTPTERSTGIFTIRHKLATVENTRLLIRSFYEGWISEIMDKHAKELLVLADFYDCSQICQLAIDSLEM